ncbi:myoD family inhibitor domain-containing protein 2-like [Anabas testudineus]|uniref:myoD family inhibitor domain-containing protein 2-like n=1 Tax=Anabas testudineus TaxID=64144 RepID=UPI000E458545|nr:myoD family inhibitor domain-containing protein 2-like [Anabas testudineus]
MDQMADEITLRADVKDKERVNTAEESAAWVRGERIQTESQVNARRPSTTTESKPEETNADTDAQQPRKCDRSSSPLFSLKMYLRRSSSTESSTEGSLSSSQQSNTGVECAGIVLNCLFCQFYDMMLMLPDSCTNHCCPNYKQVIPTVESTPSSDNEFWTDLDCGLFTSCHDANDCLELAMEVSELCYH